MIVSEADQNIWYMAKGAENWAKQETYTEFFINRLGETLGFPMAHCGLVLVDGELRFVSRNFLVEGESLTHGSLLLESFFECDLDKVGKNPWDEQRTYDIEMIDELLRSYCGPDYQRIVEGLIEMLIFDALIGSMDRHMQNWGIIATAKVPRAHHFAPIFDSARALFWDYTEERLQRISINTHALEGYANRARPKIGCAKFGKTVNHFELVQYLHRKYPVEIEKAKSKVTGENLKKSQGLMREYPFRTAFSSLRRETILRILDIRQRRLQKAFELREESHGA
jgi:hypothetical protein